MRSLRAHVSNGKLVLDETATDLAEGTEVQLVVVKTELADDERARLLKALDEAEEDFERGDAVDGFDFISTLRAKRAAVGQ